MNITKTTIGAFALTTTLLLGACGNDDMKKDENMDTNSEMKDKDMSKDNMKMMSGMFKSMNDEMVEGKATVKDGKLMLTDFKSSKTPDLHVYLTKDGNIEKGVEIDKVDYNKMKQTFDLKGKDISEYNEVTIYCKKAHVVFGSAKLK